MPFIRDIDRWRLEIQLAEDFRKKELGDYSQDEISLSGENIDYFERGWSSGYYASENDTVATTINLFHAITKNMVPSLFFNNPRINATPNRPEEQSVAHYARQITNVYYQDINAEQANKQAIWDAYVIGKGYTKIGYCTRFGSDIEDKEAKKGEQKSVLDRALEAIGMKKPKEEVKFHEANLEIIDENPYIQWLSPFQYLIDPRCTSPKNAFWMGYEMIKTVEELKSNKKFKNTKDLVGSKPDLPDKRNLSESQIEAFSTVKLYEIHYRMPDGFYLLYIAKDGVVYKELYHEKSVYKLNEWQFDEIDFSGHEHKYYKKSEMSKIKPLQNRITTTIDAILEQVDRYQPKIMVDETAMTDQSRLTLEEGDLGAIVYVTKNPNEVVREVSFTQLKSDLKALIDQFIQMISIMTGITQAQLLGAAMGSDSATEASIASGGQSIRLSDMEKEIRRFTTSQAKKLWKVIQQFVDWEELNVITGENGVDPDTGETIYTWLNPKVEDEDLLRNTDVRFDVNVGSTQKIDYGFVRKSIENLFNIIARPDVIALIQQQGKKIDLGEILKMWLDTTPEVFRDVNKIIQQVQQSTQGTMTPDMLMAQLAGGQQGGVTTGSKTNELRALTAQSPVKPQQEASQL
jgi:hypothetical protein